MPRFRLSHSADADIFDILTWSHNRFGEQARQRYESLIVAAVLHAAEHRDGAGFNAKPELGTGVLTWHLALSTQRVRGGGVRRPRHVLVPRWDGDVLVVGRVLHEKMDPTRHLDPEKDWT